MEDLVNEVADWKGLANDELVTILCKTLDKLQEHVTNGLVEEIFMSQVGS